MHLSTHATHSDPYDWCDRTMKTAHVFIEQNFTKLNDGDVVDVRVILGEEEVSALPEIWIDE